MLVGGILVAGTGLGQCLETTIPVGASPIDILWTPATNKLYVANSADNSVTIINGATNQVISTVQVGEYPAFLAWNAVNNKVYCACGEGNRLAVIDGVADTLIRLLHLAGSPMQTAYCETENKLYVSCHDDQAVAVVDGARDEVLCRVHTGTTYALLWHPVTNRLFCTDCDGDSVKVINCTNDEIVSRLHFSSSSYSPTLNPANSLVYVACGSQPVRALSPGGDSVVASLPLWANTLCAVPFPNKLYISGASGIYVADCATHTIVDSTPGYWAEWLLCDTVVGKVYGSAGYADAVYVFDAQTNRYLKTIGVGNNPGKMAWNWIDRRVYVLSAWDGSVSVIRDIGGIGEAGSRQAAPPRTASVCRGVYYWGVAEPAVLVDMSGRQVARLSKGPNDVRSLAPGVYYLRPDGMHRVQKVVISR